MIKIGVFGVGHLGKFHLNNWREMSNVEIIGFYDPNDAAAKEAETTYNIKRYEDPKELIQKVDAVDIDRKSVV